MKVELFPFQKKATAELRMKTAEALGSYHRTHTPQVVSLQAPTGSGKTIIMASLIEDILFGTDQYAEQPEAIFVWLSDSPALNEQSKQKIDLKADKIRFGQCVTIEEKSFDMEMLEEGHIYFLNTQKLGKSGKLSYHADGRQYTIWETLENTAREKADRLYFIIDEAHRGMQGREAGKATSIMQCFLKGAPKYNLSPMPVVIGISATAARFNALVGDTTSTLQKCIITANEVRSSGLLKERIIVTYANDSEKHNDMAVLQAATDEWKLKCDHWSLYCREQHYAQVNPVFVVQVLAGSGKKLSDTNLNDVIAAIEERLGAPLKENEIVHTFGSTGTITVNNLPIHHVEPSEITDDKRIRIVLFKENLSTGWDCPRAETMMSFRHAEDATYIAQLLGRMVRTPLQSHILVDDYLNDVRLFLPFFNVDNVEKIIDELNQAEGGEIPVVVDSEVLDNPVFVPWSVHTPKRKNHYVDPNQISIEESAGLVSPPITQPENSGAANTEQPTAPREVHPQSTPTFMVPKEKPPVAEADSEFSSDDGEQIKLNMGDIDREEIIKFINDKGFLTYLVRPIQRQTHYLKSLLDLSGLLTITGVYSGANAEITDDIVGMMRRYIEDLHASGRYDELSKQVLSFKLSVKIFDVFGEKLDGGFTQNLYTDSESDLDRQLRNADAKLGGFGFPNKYGKLYADLQNPAEYKVDCILFAADEKCITKLNYYARDKFHAFNDEYRMYVVNLSEQYKRQYQAIIADGDIVSKHNFSLPETISARVEDCGKEYDNHLFADENGFSKIKLNKWEEGVLEEEMKRPGFVCWLRNPPKASWALCIPYEKNDEVKSMYPDFIIVRRDDRLGYAIDILEPHGNQYADNLAKAKGMAKYAENEPKIGRVQLIHMDKDITGKNRFHRLNLSKTGTRKKLRTIHTDDELNDLFETDGVFS